MPRLARFGWFVLFFNVGVILLGALVRATGSGAGCGESWPTCQGRIIPELSGDTAIEFLHRSVSGVALVLVLVVVFWVWRTHHPGEQVRAAALISFLAIVGEALIGALIVVARWVAEDDSVARAIAVPLHLVNTFLLLGALTVTVHLLSGGRRLDITANRGLWRWLLVGAASIVLISATGAITALADTLFPKDGIGVDLSSGSHFLTRLRILHPVLAVTAAVVAWWKLGARARSGGAKSVVALVGLMLLSGVMNIAFGVPVWMQLVHLALADALWIAFVLMSVRLLEARSPIPAGDSLVTE